MGTFLGLNTSLSGLFANQRSLGIVSHNIANANTLGYSRQVMHTKAYKPQVLPGGMGTLGLGVDVTAVKQIRDGYLDKKFRIETGYKSEWDARAAVLTEIEGIFNEPTDASMSELLDKYYESLQTLQKNSENLTARTLVRQTTIALSEGMQRMSNMLVSLQREMNFQFETAVREVNDIADQIATLNETIYKAELEGGKANDLRDQRELLVDKLSELVSVDYYEDDKGRFFVLVGGQQLVAHFRNDNFEMVPRDTKVHEDDDDRIMDIQWSNGNEIYLKSGKVKGLMDVRDNISGDLKGIPYYVSKLNEFTDTLADTMNAIHEKGYGLDSSTGIYMFTMDNMTTAEFKSYMLNEGLNGGPAVQVTAGVLEGTAGLTDDELKLKIKDNMSKILANNPGYAGKSVKKIDGQYYVVDQIKASRMTISKDLEDLNKLAVASKLEELPGDGTNFLEIIATRHDNTLFAWGAPEDFVKSLVSNLGVDKNEAARVAKNQAMLVNEYSMARDSIMGVSLDEEMAHMIQFQTAYNANARMVNVFDEMLDLLVNRLGTVGR
ncbi:flagellar hook-associated protein FlgK [Fusibacter sp. JL298sf-3]